MGRLAKDIKGMRFKNLVVIEQSHRVKKSLMRKLRCDCSEICYAQSSDLKRNRIGFCKNAMIKSHIGQ